MNNIFLFCEKKTPEEIGNFQHRLLIKRADSTKTVITRLLHQKLTLEYSKQHYKDVKNH